MVIKEQRVTALMPGRRHGGDGHAVDAAGHSGRVSFEVKLNRTHVQATPATPPITEVVTRAALLTGPAAVPFHCHRTHRRDQDPALQVKIDVVDERVLDTEERAPYS
ncbi:hypothetical protein E3O06_11690 [Cryobacterium glaciale]|uniref:Uncharacterized protein n=1 Tax=Cryobacterium glaciale TaxID=1259145 RepID=A0A4R8UVP3_9MICO|nr:hypothetical protein E3O06_11690 [Cryobacterium glaciale]